MMPDDDEQAERTSDAASMPLATTAPERHIRSDGMAYDDRLLVIDARWTQLLVLQERRGGLRLVHAMADVHICEECVQLCCDTF
jgi:hypothetical protein